MLRYWFRMDAASEFEANGWSPTLSSNGHAPSTSTAVRTNQSDTHASNHVFEYDDNYDDSSDVPSLARAVDGEDENLCCVERVTVRTGELALVMDGHACDVAMIPSMMPSPPQPSLRERAVGCLCQMPHLAMLAAVETMMIQMMPRCRKPMLSPRQ